MRYERSSGAVVFTRKDGEILYVIIKALGGSYGFPKGHIEGKETEAEAAVREIREETGLSARLYTQFRTTDEYLLPRKRNVRKKVVYFVAEYENQEICYQKEELENAYLMTYEEAMKALSFESGRKILTAAREFILKLPA